MMHLKQVLLVISCTWHEAIFAVQCYHTPNFVMKLEPRQIRVLSFIYQHCFLSLLELLLGSDLRVG